MAIHELQRPTTRKEIVGTREIITFGKSHAGRTFTDRSRQKFHESLREELELPFLDEKQGLVDLIESLAFDQVVVIENPVIPQSQFHPFFDSSEGRYQTSRNRFLKQGTRAELPEVSEAQRLSEKIRAPLDDRIQILNKLDDSTLYAGMSWRGTADGITKVVRLFNAVEAARLYGHTERKRLEQRLPRDHPHVIKITNTYVPSPAPFGAMYDVWVPSVSGVITRDGKELEGYELQFRNVPLDRKNLMHLLARNMQVVSPVKSKQYDETQFQEPFMMSYGPHEIAAYLAIITDQWRSLKKQKKSGVPVALEANPFPLPRPETIDYAKKLLGQVMIRDHTYDGKSRQHSLTIQGNSEKVSHLRPLNEAEIEILTWEYIKKHGNKKLFYKTGDGNTKYKEMDMAIDPAI